MVRLIKYSNKSGSKEGVYFTDDFDMDSADAIPPGCTLDIDEQLDVDLPMDFPLNYNLERI